MSSFFQRFFQRKTQQQESGTQPPDSSPAQPEGVTAQPDYSTGRVPIPASLIAHLPKHFTPTYEWYNPTNETDFYEAVEAYRFAEQRGLEAQQKELIYDVADAFNHDQFERAQEIVRLYLMPDPFVYTGDRGHTYDFGGALHTFYLQDKGIENVWIEEYVPLEFYDKNVPPHAIRAMNVLERQYGIVPDVYGVGDKTLWNDAGTAGTGCTALFAAFGRYSISIAEWDVTVDEQPTD